MGYKIVDFDVGQAYSFLIQRMDINAMADLTEQQEAAIIKEQRRTQGPHDRISRLEEEKNFQGFLLSETTKELYSNPLTGLPNKKFLAEYFEKAGREAQQIAVIAFDLNGFKPVNDVHGHESGDTVLKNVGRLLKQNHGEENLLDRLNPSINIGALGPTVMAFHPSGDEFIIIAINHSLAEAVEIANKTHIAVAGQKHDISKNLGHQADTISVSGSFGVAAYDAKKGQGNLASLLPLADWAIYGAKAVKGEAVCVAQSENQFYRTDNTLNLVSIAPPSREVRRRAEDSPPPSKPPAFKQ